METFDILIKSLITFILIIAGGITLGVCAISLYKALTDKNDDDNHLSLT